MRAFVPVTLVLASFSFLSDASAQATLPSKASLSAADLKAAAALRDHAMKGTQAWETVASLTSEIGPRSAGSEGDRAAVAWALDRLKAAGFSNVRAQDVTVPHWERGTISVSITEPWPQNLVAAALGGSVGTSEEGVEADVIEVADLDALRALNRAQVEGRIVFINRRMQRTRDGLGYGQTVPGRSQGANIASLLGARAVVIRSVGTDANQRFAHTGTVSYKPDVPRIPAIALAHPDADLLERQIAAGKPVRLSLKSTSRDLPPMRSANVMGDIPGAGAGSEIVLLAAHLDSWDLGTGAIDDGAGVAIVIEAAKLIRDLKLSPRRTVRVVLFANEEFGLSGATAYANMPTDELGRHIVGMEADLGAGPVWRLSSNVDPAALPVVQSIADVLKPIGVERGDNKADGGADVGPLRRQGMPVLGLQLDASEYFDHHHTANDTLDKVDRKKLDQSVAAFAVAAYLSANLQGTFGRIQPEPATPR